MKNEMKDFAKNENLENENENFPKMKILKNDKIKTSHFIFQDFHFARSFSFSFSQDFSFRKISHFHFSFSFSFSRGPLAGPRGSLVRLRCCFCCWFALGRCAYCWFALGCCFLCWFVLVCCFYCWFALGALWTLIADKDGQFLGSFSARYRGD